MFRLTIDNQISIQTLHPDDAQEFFQLVEQNRSRLRPWIHPSVLPETYEAARRFTIECFFNSLSNPMDAMAKYDEYFQELGHYFPGLNPPMEMGIWMSGELVGEIMLSRLSDSFTAAEFGYWISGEREGQGVISRCVSTLMDYAIDHLGVERFVIGCAANNLRSRAIPQRLGYRLHATIPQGEIVGDLIYDRVIYGIRSLVWREWNKVKVSRAGS